MKTAAIAAVFIGGAFTAMGRLATLFQYASQHDQWGSRGVATSVAALRRRRCHAHCFASRHEAFDIVARAGDARVRKLPLHDRLFKYCALVSSH